MLYKKNGAPKLEQSLFENPTAEYRGTPFWAWNCELKKEELLWQLEVLKKMGFGGGHMHVRTGMATPYLSDEYMDLIKACVDKAKSEEMLAWLYDEDRWPSGAAGGLVTKDKEFRARHLLFTPVPYVGDGGIMLETSSAKASRTENGYLLASFDVQLDKEGYLISAKKIEEDEEAVYEKWYAYVEQNSESGWYNNQTYVDTLNKKAMQRFIDITYEAYNRTIGDEFDKTVPSIFTDEPQFTRKSTLKFATDKDDVTLPWTDDLAETFGAAYEGEDVIAGIPELIWDRADGEVSLIRYHYHDHICERFAQAFADQCGTWCREHGMALTGHMMEEPTLESQTAALGEAMRSYRGFDLPGIDMLCARFEYTTAKQTQSAVHQFGYEGMLSELYGVTNWDFDFRGHKLHGDWQAALGVTIRVPHLSWVSMAGEAKRDYPASISYQSPWWEQYRLVEDHFARVNTAMTRGVPVVKVGVIHPVESYWLHWGPAEQTAMVRDELDQNFQNLTEWLLFGSVDFDFISESLLPTQCEKGGAPLQVGHMNYDVILVPGCETLRASTLERLEAFAAAGGKLVFAGQIPTLVDARPSTRPAKLAAKCQCIPLSEGAVLQAAEAGRVVEIRNQTGSLTKNLLYQMRQDGDGRWLFICNAKEPYNKDVARYQDLRIRVAGGWKPTLYQTMDGTTAPIDFETADGQTEIRCRMYDYDSMLLYLEPCEAGSYAGCDGNAAAGQMLKLPVLMDYTLSEPNALLLDQAEYALDDEDWQPCEEILRLDNICREKLSWPTRKEALVQPWVVPDEPITHSVKLRFTFNAAYAVSGASLAIEDAERLQLNLNGAAVPAQVTGWYTDKSIKTIALPELKAGENVLEVVVPFGRRTNLEWCYILGDFGVEVSGRYACIVPAREKIAFGDFTRQGLPFYGGNVTYHIPVTTAGGELTLRSSHYRGALQKVSVDGGKAEAVIYPPYTVSLGSVPAGEHVIDLTLYGHRRNSFGPVHLADLKETWIGPGAWRSEGDRWCYDYKICEEGILSTPEVIEK
ncbi:MAG: hypothetical protein IKL38_08015 [Firmicutes bacterium]|nr:hypothetical protein [Bacillota bacterium]